MSTNGSPTRRSSSGKASARLSRTAELPQLPRSLKLLTILAIAPPCGWLSEASTVRKSPSEPTPRLSSMRPKTFRPTFDGRAGMQRESADTRGVTSLTNSVQLSYRKPAFRGHPVNERIQHNDGLPVERRAVRTRSGGHIVRKHRIVLCPSPQAFVGVLQHHGRPGSAASSPAPARTRSSYLPGHARRRCSTSPQRRRCRRTAGRVTRSVRLRDLARQRAQRGSIVVRDR